VRPDAIKLEATEPSTPSDPAARLRRAERWLIPASLAGLLLIVALGWQWIRLSRPALLRDGVVTLNEAQYWARSNSLQGLTIAEVARLIDGPVEPLGNGVTAARVPIQPIPGRANSSWLELTLDAGRVSAVKLHR
jgi:hypothetical protein